MYDMAKRSLAFTVATGGLLLTGTGFTPAEAAVGSGAITGPAPAQGSTAARHGSQSADSAPISVAGSNGGKSTQTLQQTLDALTPIALDGQSAHERPDAQNAPGSRGMQDPQNAQAGQNAPTQQNEPGIQDVSGAGPNSSAQSVVSNSGGVLSGNSVQIPIALPVNLCGNQANVAALLNLNSGAECEIGAGQGGGSHASASGTTVGSGGVASGNQIQIPVNAPINICGNQINLGAVANFNGPSECGVDTPTTPPPTTPPPCEHCSPPPTTAVPTTPPPCEHCSPPPSTPPPSEHCTPPSGSAPPTETAPPGESHTPAPGGHLASTGTEEGAALAAAGAALLAGVGLRAASKRGRRSR